MSVPAPRVEICSPLSLCVCVCVCVCVCEGTDPSLPSLLLNSHTNFVPVFPVCVCVCVCVCVSVSVCVYVCDRTNVNKVPEEACPQEARGRSSCVCLRVCVCASAQG